MTWRRPTRCSRPPAEAALCGGDRRGAAGRAALATSRYAVQSSIAAAAERDRADYGIVAEYGGHGIGTAMHMDPFLPNHGDPGHGPRLRRRHGARHRADDHRGRPRDRRAGRRLDGRHGDGARAVHWEHSVAITDDGPRVLTLPA